jgi:hypothetical protein
MDKKVLLSRRQFLTRIPAALAAVLGAAALSDSGLLQTRRFEATARAAPPLTPRAYLPFVAHPDPCAVPPFCGKVVHVHSPGATDWGGVDQHWKHVNQAAVDSMVTQGLLALTGAGTVADAWRILIPDYQTGQKVAIKVNFNNTSTCGNTSGTIDALIEPVNAVASGLLQIGVQPEDICVYDAVRALPDRFVSQAQYGVRFFDGREGDCGAEAGFIYQPESRITFYPPPGVSVAAEYVTNVLMNAAYLINMPIMKGSHSLTGVTLGFKNHFGTIHNCAGLHDPVNVRGQPPAYRSDYNPLVDLIRSPLIGGKTVLTIGDGLFAAKNWVQPPVTWTTFGDQVPQSLFFASDPVAIDCVMHDMLLAEPGTGICAGSNNYLRLAAEAGLGVFEQGNPWQMPYGSGYQDIRYVRIEL